MTMDDASDEPQHDQPPLREVPADEQHAFEHPESLVLFPRLLVVAGAALVCVSIMAWMRMGLDFPYEGWQRFLPAMAFLALLIGGGLVFYGVYLTMLEPPSNSGNRFAAWGRFAVGIAFTAFGILGKSLLVENKKAPPEAIAISMMCLIAGPVLCGWACYGTFVKDRSQRDTGFLMMLALAIFLVLLLWK